MLNYIASRIGQTLLILLLMSAAVFFLLRIPGDPAVTMLPLEATREDHVILLHHLGLDKPLPVQYLIFLKLALQGNFGKSLLRHVPVGELIWRHGLNSLKLTVFSICLAVMIGVPLGVLAAVKKGKVLDLVSRTIGVLGQSAPVFLVGLILMYLFSIRLHLFPVVGMGGLSYYFLPGITLAWFIAAGVVRLTRSAMLDALDADYVTLARIKGLTERVVIWRHALRNALIPIVTFIGMFLGMSLGGVVVVETIFGWPGIGLLLYHATLGRDFPVAQAVILVALTFVIIMNFIVDIAYGYIDPRIRYQKKS